MNKTWKSDWERCVAFHGHQCPGLAIGFRVTMAARKQLGVTSAADEELVCVTENDSCSLDAVQALLSCTLGKGNLLYRDRGKQAFSFFLRKQNKKLRIRLTHLLNKETGDRKTYQQEILSLPDEEIFSFTEPAYDLPVKAKIFKTVACEQCGEPAVESKIRLYEEKKLCLDCAPEYSRRW
ncbi:MAG: FmdE family protein [Candidatus Electrothrix sp. GW3-4]|uniref:FmdE family protein n=1 Tax=Candidatus Electrothrix sp. GW3-4 TaxID=3126740 RepID=UPI0030CBF3C8